MIFLGGAESAERLNQQAKQHREMLRPRVSVGFGMTDKLKPCPLCGAKFLLSQEPLDNYPVEGKFYIYHEYGGLDSAARKCRLSINGHFDSKEEALTMWNTRA